MNEIVDVMLRIKDADTGKIKQFINLKDLNLK